MLAQKVQTASIRGVAGSGGVGPKIDAFVRHARRHTHNRWCGSSGASHIKLRKPSRCKNGKLNSVGWPCEEIYKSAIAVGSFCD